MPPPYVVPVSNRCSTPHSDQRDPFSAMSAPAPFEVMRFLVRGITGYVQEAAWQAVVLGWRCSRRRWGAQRLPG